MTEEEAKELGKAYTELKGQTAQKGQRIQELEGLLVGALLRIEELERRLAKDSRNSSKPPSSDGLGRKLGKPRHPSGKPPGGQKITSQPGGWGSLTESASSEDSRLSRSSQ